MEDIHRLEKYIEQRETKKNKRRNRFIILLSILAFLAIAIFLWGYGFINSEKLNSFFEKTSSETISPIKKESPEIEVTKKEQIKEIKEREKPTIPPSQSNSVLSSLPSLIIKGEFISGKPLQYFVKNHGDKKHDIDFGDGRNFQIKNKATHIYDSPGEYQVIFYPKNTDQIITETIFIRRSSNIENDKSDFVSLIQSLEKKQENKAVVMTALDQKASFPGGTEAFMSYIQTHIGNVSGYKGKVLIQFNISEKGKVEKPFIIDGLNKKIDMEILKAFTGMPNWIPAKNKGRNVKSEYRIPLYFEKES